MKKYSESKNRHEPRFSPILTPIDVAKADVLMNNRGPY